MSVTNDADLALQRARDHVAEAQNELWSILGKRVGGADQLSAEFRQKLAAAMLDLFGIEEILQ